jgi:hypothetical protein
MTLVLKTPDIKNISGHHIYGGTTISALKTTTGKKWSYKNTLQNTSVVEQAADQREAERAEVYLRDPAKQQEVEQKEAAGQRGEEEEIKIK